jgi:hypothetical protein
MKFIGSAAVAVVVLLIADEALNDERFTHANAMREADHDGTTVHIHGLAFR